MAEVSGEPFQDDGAVDREYEAFLQRAGMAGAQPKNAKHYSHVPEEPGEGFEAKHTLLSRQAKKTNKTGGSLSFVNEADFSKLQPRLAESEVRENTLLKNLEESNSTLRAQLVKVADEKEALERELRKLRRELEDLEAELKRKEKWRKQALDLEEEKDRLDQELRKAQRKLAAAEERAQSAERKTVETETLRTEVRTLQERLRGSNGELNVLLKNLRAGHEDEGENRNLLKEVIKKVDELSRKSRAG